MGELDTLGTGRGGYLRPGPEEKDHAMGIECVSYQPCGIRILTLHLKRRAVGLHESMRGTNFGTVDGAITSGFEDC